MYSKSPLTATALTGVLAMLLLAACSGLAPGKTEATAFEDPQTGQVADVCGPIQGFKGAVAKAQRGCDQAWQAKGWVPLNQSIVALSE